MKFYHWKLTCRHFIDNIIACIVLCSLWNSIPLSVCCKFTTHYSFHLQRRGISFFVQVPISNSLSRQSDIMFIVLYPPFSSKHFLSSLNTTCDDILRYYVIFRRNNFEQTYLPKTLLFVICIHGIHSSPGNLQNLSRFSKKNWSLASKAVWFLFSVL